MSFSEESISNSSIGLQEIEISFERSFEQTSQQIGFINKLMQNEGENGSSYVQLEDSAKLFNENPNGLFKLPKQKYNLKRACTKRFTSDIYVI